MGALVAADGPVPQATDVRFAYALSGDRYVIRSDGALPDDGQWDRSEHVRLEVLRSQRAPFGLGGGFAIHGVRRHDAHDGERMDETGVSGRFTVAVAAMPVSHLQVEVAPFAGYGLAEFSYDPAPASVLVRTSDRDDFVEYGLHLNAVITTDGGLQFGGAVGYAVQDATYELSRPGDGTTSVESSGAVYSVFIGTRH